MPKTIHISRLVGPQCTGGANVVATAQPGSEARDRLVLFYEEAVAATFWPRDGDVFREYLASHRDEWSEARRRLALRALIERHVLAGASAPRALLQRFMCGLDTILATEEYAALREADQVWYAAPVVVEIGRDGVLRARPDILYRHGNTWQALDFDSRAISGDDAALAVVNDALRREIRAACYLIAMRRKLGGGAQCAVSYIYTSAGVSLVNHPTAAWLDGWEEALPRLSGEVLGCDTGILPVWRSEQRSFAKPYTGRATLPTPNRGPANDQFNPAPAVAGFAENT